MQFGLRTLLLLFVVLWSALAAFANAGILVTLLVLLIAVGIHTFHRLTVGEWLAIGFIILVLIGLLVPAIVVTGIGPEERCNQCVDHLERLAQALRAYHDTYGSFPPALVADATGNPMHSWRVEMLPFLDASDAYQKYDHSEPWNSRMNNGAMVHCSRRSGSDFFCMSDPCWSRAGKTIDFTSYFAVVGPQTAWRGPTPTKRSDLPDRGKRMILLVESADRAIDWKEPKDLSYDEASAGICLPSVPGISSGHAIGNDYFHNARRGAHVAFVDGSVHFLPEDIPPEDLRALLTGDITRPIDLEALAHPTLNWSHIVSLAVFIASSAILIVGAVVQRLHREAPSSNSTDEDEQMERSCQE
jgi:hypothetical protein